jgi:geranylgeranyl pyrophosphate synthase
VIDDILDVTQTTEKLGKTAGKDITATKATFPAIYGLEKSRAEARKLTAQAHAAIKPFGVKASRLREIADYPPLARVLASCAADQRLPNWRRLNPSKAAKPGAESVAVT